MNYSGMSRKKDYKESRTKVGELNSLLKKEEAKTLAPPITGTIFNMS